MKYFGEIVDGNMHFSNTGVIADLLWHEMHNHVQDVELGEFVVMPNHIHCILTLTAYKPDEVTTNETTNEVISATTGTGAKTTLTDPDAITTPSPNKGITPATSNVPDNDSGIDDSDLEFDETKNQGVDIVRFDIVGLDIVPDISGIETRPQIGI